MTTFIITAETKKTEILSFIAENGIQPADLGFGSNRQMVRTKRDQLAEALNDHLNKQAAAKLAAAGEKKTTRAERKAAEVAEWSQNEDVIATIDLVEGETISKSQAIRDLLQIEVPRPIICELLNAHPSFVGNIAKNAYQRNSIELTAAGIEIKMTYLGEKSAAIELAVSSLVRDFMDEAFPSMGNPTRQELRAALAELVSDEGVRHIHVGSIPTDEQD